ncbi:MAG: M23 family metallopeptidase [Deltaproteobacteria bacterium]|nr:M23 family metallopeptidase [Deltaproteobacteria bacterium]
MRKIAVRFNVSTEEIFEINDLGEPVRLKVGQKIRIPYRGQVLRKEDQQALRTNLIVRPAAKESSVKQVSLSTAKRWVGKLLWPLETEGRISSQFGRRWFSFHEGVDIAEEEGTKILAAHDGVVAYSGSGLRGYGNLVVIKGDGILTVYGHNRRNRVKVGKRVSKGDWIADLGSTGKSSGPHLHFETRIRDSNNKNIAVDPMAFFK